MDLILLLREAGTFGYVIVLVPAFALPFLIVLAALSLFRNRVPAPIWFLAPVTTLLLGHAGVVYGTLQVQAALRHADPATKAALSAAGLSESLTSRLFAQGTALLLFTAIAALAAVSSVRAGEARRWTPGHAVAPVVFAFLAALAGVGAAFTADPGGWVLAGIAPIGGLLLAIACLAVDEDDAHTARMASARGVVGTALLGAGLSVFATELTLGRILAFSAVANADPSMKSTLLAEAMRVYPWNLVPAIALLGLAGATALAPVAHALDRRALLGAGLTGALLFVPGAARVLVDLWSAGAMMSVMGPATGP